MSENAFEAWMKQANSPAASSGQQQVATNNAAASGGTPQNALQAWQQDARGGTMVDQARSWYTGANAAGQQSGWDTSFYNDFSERFSQAVAKGEAKDYFRQENATGVVTWDDESDKFGDIYQDGQKVGNVYETFGKETADLMMYDLVEGDGVRKARVFARADRTDRIADAVDTARKERSKQLETSDQAIGFNQSVQERAEDWANAGVRQDVATTAAGAVGGAATGAGVGAALTAWLGPGAAAGAAVGGIAGGLVGGAAGYLNQDAITEQAARGYEITALAKKEEGMPAAIATGTKEAGGLAMKLSSPLSSLVEGLEDARAGKVGDTEAEFYAVDKKGDRETPVAMRVAHLGATLTDSLAQFASPVGRTIFQAEMGAVVAGEVGGLITTQGKMFDYAEGGFDSVWRDDEGNFDPGSAAAAVGKIAIDAVQMGGVGGLARQSAIISGAKTVDEPIRSAGFKYITNEAGEIVGKRATLALAAPSEQVQAASTWWKARMTAIAERGQGAAVTADDFYRASQQVASGSNRMKLAAVTAFGEGYEEAVQAVLEPIALNNDIDGSDVANAFFYGAAAGAGMGLAQNLDRLPQGEYMKAQAQMLESIRQGREVPDAEFDQMWDQLSPTEQRVAATRNKTDMAITRDAFAKMAREQAATLVASEPDAAKALDARRTAAEQELAKATNRSDQYTVIAGQTAVGELNDIGELLLNEKHESVIEMSAAQAYSTFADALSGLEEQRKAMAARDDADSQVALVAIQSQIAFGRQMLDDLQAEFDTIYSTDPGDPAADAAIDEINRTLTRHYRAIETVGLNEATETAARFTTVLHAREPSFLDAGSYVAAMPWVSKSLTAERANNVKLPTMDMIGALNADFDGDMIHPVTQMSLDAETFRRIRAGEFYVGPGAKVDIASRNFDGQMAAAVAKGLAQTGTPMATEAQAAMDRIRTALTHRYDDTILSPEQFDSVWEDFVTQVRAGSEDARTGLINALARVAGGPITDLGRANYRNEWLWIGQAVRSSFQKYQRSYRNIRNSYGDSPTAPMTVQSDLSPEGTNRRKQRATTTAQTLALFAPGNTLFRKFQKIHYSFFNSSVLRAEGVEPSDLQELSRVYAELSRGVTRTEMERTNAQDTVSARVLAMLDRIVQTMELDGDLPDDWSPAQAMTLLANVKVRDVFEENGSYYTDGVDLSLGQLLLKRALDQEKAEHIRTWETDQQLQAKHARLRALTIGNKVADRQNAEAAFIEIFGEVVFFDALGSSTGSFAPNTTPNQWLRNYRTLDATARTQMERLFKLEPEYLNRKETSNPPYSMKELDSGGVSPYHTMLDALMAVGRGELSMRDDGTLSGSMPEQSDRAGAAFRDSHASVRQAMQDWRKLSRRQKKATSGPEAVQEFFASDPAFARAVLDLVPNAKANGLYDFRNGQLYVSSWVYDMFNIADSNEALMFYWRNLTLTMWRSTQAQLNEGGPDAHRPLLDRLDSRFQQLLARLAMEPGQKNLELLVRRMSSAKDLDEFFRWINTESGFKGMDAPYMPFTDDVADFDIRRGGVFSSGGLSSDVRTAMMDLKVRAAEFAKSTAYLNRRDIEDRTRLQDIKAALAAGDDTHPDVVKLQSALVRTKETPRAFGPSAMMALVRGAVRGFDPSSHDKGKTAKSFGPIGEFQALMDAWGFKPGIERDMGEITALDMSDLRNNVGDMAKRGGTAMDAFGNPVKWNELDIETAVQLLDDPATANLALTMLIPQAMDITPDGKLTDRSWMEPSLSALLDGDAYTEVYQRNENGALSLDQSARYLSQLDALTRTEGGAFDAIKAVIDLAVARTSALDHVATEYDIQKLTNQAIMDVASVMQEVGRIQSNGSAVQADLLDTAKQFAIKELQTQRKLRVGEKLPDSVAKAGVENWVKIAVAQTEQARVDALKAVRAAGLPASDKQVTALNAQFDRMVAELEALVDDDIVVNAINGFQDYSRLADYALSMANFPDRAPEAADVWQELVQQKRAGVTIYDLSDSQWEKLSLSATGVYLADKQIAVASHVQIPAMPKGDPAVQDSRFFKYFDPAYTHIAHTLLDDTSPLAKAAAKLHQAAGQAYSNISITDVQRTLKRTILKDFSFGPLTPGITSQIMEAHQRVDSSSSPGAIAAAGGGPTRWATVSAATRRTQEVPDPNLTTTVAFPGSILFTEPDSTPKGVTLVDRFETMIDARTSLAMLDNRFMSRLSINGQEISLDEPNLGFTWNREEAPTGFFAVSLRRLKQIVDEYAAFHGIDAADYSGMNIEVDFLHPFDQPEGEEWYHNVYFEGMSHTLTPDGNRSLIATLWADNGGLTGMYTQWPLDAGKKGKKAIQQYRPIEPTLIESAENAFLVDGDYGKMLRMKTDLLMQRDHGFGLLEPEYYNAVLKTMKLQHILVGQRGDARVIMTSEQALAAQARGEDLSDLTLRKLSGEVLRSALGELGEQGVPRYFDDEFQVNVDLTTPFRGFSTNALSRFADGWVNDFIGPERTSLAHRTRSKILTVRAMATEAEVQSRKERIDFLVGEQQRVHMARASKISGANVRDNYVAVLQDAAGSLQASWSTMDFASAGINFFPPRNNNSTAFSVNVLETLQNEQETNFRNGWRITDGQPTGRGVVGGELTISTLDSKPADEYRMVKDDVAWLQLETFNDFDRVEIGLRYVTERGATIILSEQDGGDDIRDGAAKWLIEHNYSKMRGSKHVWVPNEFSARFQNDRAYESTLLETDQVTPSKNSLIFLAQDPIGTDENTALLNERSSKLRDRILLRNLLPSSNYSNFNVPIDDGRDNGQYDDALRHLRSVLSNADQRDALLKMGGRDPANEITLDEALDRFHTRITQTNSLEPEVGDEYLRGDIIPLVHMFTGKIIFYRHGFKMPDPRDVDALAEKSGVGIALAESKVDETITAKSGRIEKVEPRGGYGRSLAISSPMQIIGDKNVLELGGFKTIGARPDERTFQFPSVSVFANGTELDMAYDKASSDSKESVQDRITNYRSALAFFQNDFTEDLTEFFFPGSAADEATRAKSRALTYTFLDQLSRNQDLKIPLVDAHALQKFVPTLADHLSSWGQANSPTKDSSWLDRLTSGQTAGDQIARAMLIYLMTPGSDLDNVLRTNGFSHPNANDDLLKTRRVPGLFADLLDNGADSAVHTELMRRWNNQLNAGPNGEGYVLHPDWTFEVFSQGGSVRGVLQFGQVIGSGDNPILDGQSYNPGAPSGVSPTNTMAASMSVSGINAHKPLTKTEAFANAFKRGDGAKPYSEAGEMWTMLNGMPLGQESPQPGWRVETAAELARRVAAREEIKGYYVELDKSNEAGWSDSDRNNYTQRSVRLLDAMNLDATLAPMVDGWIRQMLGRPFGEDIDGNDVSRIKPKDVFEILAAMTTNVNSGRLPIAGAAVPLMDVNQLTAIYMANVQRGANGWSPTEAVSWDDWVNVAFGTTFDDKMNQAFDALHTLAVDGFMHGYQGATDHTRYLPVTVDEMRLQKLIDPETNALLVSISDDDNQLATDPVAFNTARAELEQIIEGARTYGTLRSIPDPESAMGGLRARLKRWRFEQGVPTPVGKHIRGVRGSGQRFIEHTTKTTSLMRMMVNLRVGNALLNPALIVSAPVEAAARRTIDSLADIVTGESVGAVGRRFARVTESFQDKTIGAVAERLGLVSTYTVKTLDQVKTLVPALASRSDFKAEVYRELAFQYPSIPGIGPVEKALESYAKLGGVLQDPAWGLLPNDLSRIYIKTVLRKVAADPIGDNVYSVETLLNSLARDPLWVKKNDLEAHNMAIAAIANIRSLRPTMLSAMVRGVVDPMTESPSLPMNAAGHFVKMLTAFQNFWSNAIINWGGLQAADMFAAMALDGKQKPHIIGRMQAKVRGVPYDPEQPEYFDMSEMLESMDLADAFVKGGVTHTALFTLGMFSGGFSALGEDDEMRKRRKLLEAENAPKVYDARAVESDFRNKDAIYLDFLPDWAESYFMPKDGGDNARPMAQMTWVAKTFLSPIIGFQRFYENGDPSEILYGFKDAIGSHPIMNATLWNNAVETYAEATGSAAEAAKAGDQPAAVNFMVQGVGVLERMLFENAFLNTMYIGLDEYDRDPYKMLALNETGQQLTDARGNPLPSEAMNQFVDENGQVKQGYIDRGEAGATWRTFSENRFGMALIGSLWNGLTGGGSPFSSDMWRQNMAIKEQEILRRQLTQTEAEELLRAELTAAGTPEILSQDEAERALKNLYQSRGIWWDAADIEKQAKQAVAQGFGAPMSIMTSEGEQITDDGVKAIIEGLRVGVLKPNDASLQGLYIPYEMRLKIQDEMVAELITEGQRRFGLTREASVYRAKRIWNGGTFGDSDAIGMSDLLWTKAADGIPYSDSMKMQQLNTTYVMGPEGKMYATGFKRSGIFGALGLNPLNRTWASEEGSVDERLNTVLGQNTGLRALRATAEVAPKPKLPDFESLANKAATEDAAGYGAKSGYSRGYGRRGYSRGSRGGYGGGSTYSPNIYFSEMNRLQYGISTYGNDISFINTTNPIIRRSTISRQRVWSERGRLKQWQ